MHRIRKIDAQMAESVDALVSNTSGATHPGSTPGLGTKQGRKSKDLRPCSFYNDEKQKFKTNDDINSIK